MQLQIEKMEAEIKDAEFEIGKNTQDSLRQIEKQMVHEYMGRKQDTMDGTSQESKEWEGVDRERGLRKQLDSLKEELERKEVLN